ncbi:hypothetical protein [Sulfitobacter sp. HGT1]|jgi:hypothetical protein|uniref:hypothetical protein n=1 Tax=unclassified Sulfitobacter TaxID=196795 RepID=UPI0015938531|nr:hypothetical protein [Sulfitobacter sp. HGT1]MBQ0805350.1 hypothetical protein [Sulfitobacter sp.]
MMAQDRKNNKAFFVILRHQTAMLHRRMTLRPRLKGFPTKRLHDNVISPMNCCICNSITGSCDPD